jgi:hypothetical protein
MVEKIRRIVLSIVAFMFIVFIIYIIYSMYHGKKQYVERKYSGIIYEIRNLEGNRDLPDIRIDNRWIPFSIDDSKVKSYIQVGDSIIKESGTEIIYVYRKDLNGDWKVKTFK